MIKLMREYRPDEEKDSYYINKEWSILKGLYDSSDEKVEIEDIKHREDKWRALAQLDKFCRMVPEGLLLWIGTYVSGFTIGFHVDCSTGQMPEEWGFLARHATYCVLIPATIYLLWQINTMTNLMSKTTFEGKPFVRFIHSANGANNYYVQIFFAAMTLSSMVTRAVFAGRVMQCGRNEDTHYDRTFTESYVGTSSEFLIPIVKPLGFGGMAAISVFGGAFLIQGGLFLSSLTLIWRKVGAIQNDLIEEVPEEPGLDINQYLQTYAALADWAILKPCSFVFFCSALPLQLDDKEDYYRCWRACKMKAITIIVNLIPDSFLMTWLMANYYVLAFDTQSLMANVTMMFSMVCTIAVCFNTAHSLIQQDFTFTAVYGVLIVLLFIDPIIRIVGVWVCHHHGSHQFIIFDWKCM